MSVEKMKRAKRKAADVRKTEMKDMSKNTDKNAREWMKRPAYQKSRLSSAAKALIRAQAEQIFRKEGDAGE